MDDDRRASGDTPEDGPIEGTPRWVKAFIAVVAPLIVLFVTVQFVGDGGHGPGRHGGGADAPADMNGREGHGGPLAGNHGGEHP